MIVQPRRARLYPDNVEKKFGVAKCIEFFGFMAYSDLTREECMPNPIFKSRNSNLSFAQFDDVVFQKTRPKVIPEKVECEEESEPTQPFSTTETNKEGENVAVYDSDYEEGDEVYESLRDYCF